jgi:hypothetical protein
MKLVNFLIRFFLCRHHIREKCTNGYGLYPRSQKIHIPTVLLSAPQKNNHCTLSRNVDSFQMLSQLGFAVYRPRFYRLSCYTIQYVRQFANKKGPKKVKKKEKGVPEEVNSKEQDFFSRCLNAKKAIEPPISEEEKLRRYNVGRNYVIGNFNLHNEIQHDLSCKMKLKTLAIQMLPRGTVWKEEALRLPNPSTIDLEMFPPVNRSLPWEPWIYKK